MAREVALRIREWSTGEGLRSLGTQLLHVSHIADEASDCIAAKGWYLTEAFIEFLYLIPSDSKKNPNRVSKGGLPYADLELMKEIWDE